MESIQQQLSDIEISSALAEQQAISNIGLENLKKHIGGNEGTEPENEQLDEQTKSFMRKAIQLKWTLLTYDYVFGYKQFSVDSETFDANFEETVCDTCSYALDYCKDQTQYCKDYGSDNQHRQVVLEALNDLIEHCIMYPEIKKINSSQLTDLRESYLSLKTD